MSQDRLDDLQVGGLQIYQNDELYSFTSDAVLLANFEPIKKDALVVDFGTGCGIMAILIAFKSRAKKVIGIEIQKSMSDMASRSVELNGLSNKITIINDRIQNIEKYTGKNCVDIVVCNPPYSKVGTCKQSSIENQCIARHEVEISLAQIFEYASHILTQKGELRMVHKSQRLGEIIERASEFGFTLKTLRLVQSFENTAPYLVLLKFVKGGGYETKTLPTLVMNNLDGTYTDEVREIYRKEKL